MASDVPPRVKYSFDTPVDVNRDALIDAVYQAQVDLQIVADWLSQQPDPVILYGAVHSINHYSQMLAEFMPSVARH